MDWYYALATCRHPNRINVTSQVGEVIAWTCRTCSAKGAVWHPPKKPTSISKECNWCGNEYVVLFASVRKNQIAMYRRFCSVGCCDEDREDRRETGRVLAGASRRGRKLTGWTGGIPDVIRLEQQKAKRLITAVARTSGLSLDEMLAASRYRVVTQTRAVAVFVVRKHTSLPWADIMMLFGGRARATITQADKRVRGWLAGGASLAKRRWVEEIVREVV